MKVSSSLVALLWVMGCTSGPTTVEEPPSAVEQAVDESPTEAVVESVEVEEPAPEVRPTYVKKKLSIYVADGVLDEYTTYVYDPSNSRIVREETYSGMEDLIQSVEYQHDGDEVVRRTVLNPDGSIANFREYSHGDHGLESDTLYQSGQKKQTNVTFEYDSDGRLAKWSVHDGTGMLLAYNTYSYAEGLLAKITMVGQAGAADGHVAFDYTPEGAKGREAYFTAEGQLEKSVEYTYQDGKLSEEAFLSGRGRVTRRVFYEYDAAGNLTTLCDTDGQGNVRGIQEYEYDAIPPPQ